MCEEDKSKEVPEDDSEQVEIEVKLSDETTEKKKLSNDTAEAFVELGNKDKCILGGIAKGMKNVLGLDESKIELSKGIEKSALDLPSPIMSSNPAADIYTRTPMPIMKHPTEYTTEAVYELNRTLNKQLLRTEESNRLLQEQNTVIRKELNAERRNRNWITFLWIVATIILSRVLPWGWNVLYGYYYG